MISTSFCLVLRIFFAGPDDSLGNTSLLKHTIDTGTAPPIRQPVRRIFPSKRQEVSQLLESMLKKDVIQQSSSPWASPIILVQKKDGSTRFAWTIASSTVLLEKMRTPCHG